MMATINTISRVPSFGIVITLRFYGNKGKAALSTTWILEVAWSSKADCHMADSEHLHLLLGV
jgi:hypothetical protein